MSIDENLKVTRMAQDGRSEVDESYGSQVAENDCPIPELASLFAKMESGTVPNWHDFMSAVSAMVAFYTDCDSPSQCGLENNFCMSQK